MSSTNAINQTPVNHSQEKDKDNKVAVSSALKKSSRYRSRSLSASSTDSYSSGKSARSFSVSALVFNLSARKLQHTTIVTAPAMRCLVFISHDKSDDVE
jgi:hypothetical protein